MSGYVMLHYVTSG